MKGSVNEALLPRFSLWSLKKKSDVVEIESVAEG